MKRTQNINLNAMRKSSPQSRAKPSQQRIKKTTPLTLAIAAILGGCAQPTQEALVVKSPEECAQLTPNSLEECEAAYQKAVAEAERTGPKYSQQAACEAEFGPEQCGRTSSGFFTPFITGYLVSSLLNSGGNSYNPVYHYQGRGSNYNKIMTADGHVLGRSGASRYKVPEKYIKKPMPTVKRTVSRGGFGSVAAAKSNWGSSSRRGGWGG